MTRPFRIGPLCLLVGLSLIGCYHLAHGAVGPAEAMPASGGAAAAVPAWLAWLGYILAAAAGVETLLRGASMALHAIAPHTTTTLDDRAADRIDELHDKLDKFIATVSTVVTPPAPVGGSVVGGAAKATMFALLIAGAALLGGATLTSCATPAVQNLKTEGTTAVRAVLDCEKQMAPAQLEAALVMLAVDAATYVLPGGAGPDWGKLAELAIADASNVKACALAEYHAVTGAQPAPQTALRLAAPDVAPNPLAAALARVKAARGVAAIVTPGGSV